MRLTARLVAAAALVGLAALPAQAGQVGQIKAGTWGDLVGVRGDPLVDIRVLEKPIFVMKGGQTVRKP